MQEFNVNPEPKYKDTRAAGNLFPYTTQTMATKPSFKMLIQVSDLKIISDLVNSTQSATVVFRDSTDSVNLVLRGAFVNSCTIKGANGSDSYVQVDFSFMAMTAASSASDITGSVFAVAPKTSTAIPMQSVTFTADGTVIEDWKRFEFTYRKTFIRRIAPSNGATRTITHVKSEVSFKVTRSMLATDALSQQSNILAGTDATLLLEIVSSTLPQTQTWLATMTGAKPTGYVKVATKTSTDGEVTDSEVVYSYAVPTVVYSFTVA